ncbi:MAG: OmpA family protein [Deltaproteobacteria bacterium]|nr:OmpA family protein [Deltaproteobacteria bacterium]MBN2688782.1 OmpA family protein [Deltaproteobacteria bacterium]
MDGKDKRKKRRDDLPAAGWEVIYCSLALILVAFFAMLVSYSKIQGNDMINFLRGFGGPVEKGSTWSAGAPPSSEFINVYTGGSRASGKSSRIGRRGFYDIDDHDGAAMPGAEELTDMADVYTGGDRSDSEDSFLRSIGEMSDRDEDKVLLSMGYLDTYFEKMGLQGDVDVTKTRSGFKVTMTSGVLFPSGVAAVNAAAYPSLDGITKLIQAVPYAVRVEGHTDNVPIATDAYPSNWELSTARAVNVLRYFLEVGKVAPMKISAVGFGEYHPVASNDTEEGRMKNRRVDLYFELSNEQANVSRKGTG